MEDAGVEINMGISEGLPHRLIKQREVTYLPQETEEIEEALAVFAFKEDAGVLEDHAAAVF